VVVFQQLNSGVSVFALMAIPFFIFAGELMVRGDIARRLVALAGAMVGHMRGGLGQVNITASVLFGGISGSAAADATAIGGLMIPQMKEKGYSVEYGVNVTVISSIIALMLPPSHNMIIYSISAGGRLSIADLFTAGIIPGLLLAVSLDGHRLVRRQEGRLSDRDVSRLGHAGRDVRQRHSRHPADRHHLRRRAFGHFHRFGKLLHRGGLCAACHDARLSHHELGPLRRGHQGGRSHHGHGAAGDRLRGLLRLAACLSRIPAELVELMKAVSDNPIIILLMINLVLLMLGTFMDMSPLIVITTPIFLPVATAFGSTRCISASSWCSISASGFARRRWGRCCSSAAPWARISVWDAIRTIWPFYGAALFTLLLVTYIPSLSLWLPSLFH
jgi:TRAP-type C4-dicarboxylate transport system permease large subunit